MTVAGEQMDFPFPFPIQRVAAEILEEIDSYQVTVDMFTELQAPFQ